MSIGHSISQSPCMDNQLKKHSSVMLFLAYGPMMKCAVLQWLGEIGVPYNCVHNVTTAVSPNYKVNGNTLQWSHYVHNRTLLFPQLAPPMASIAQIVSILGCEMRTCGQNDIFLSCSGCGRQVLLGCYGE